MSGKLWQCTVCDEEFDHIYDAEDHFITRHGEMSAGEVKEVPE